MCDPSIDDLIFEMQQAVVREQPRARTGLMQRKVMGEIFDRFAQSRRCKCDEANEAKHMRLELLAVPKPEIVFLRLTRRFFKEATIAVQSIGSVGVSNCRKSRPATAATRAGSPPRAVMKSTAPCAAAANTTELPALLS